MIAKTAITGQYDHLSIDSKRSSRSKQTSLSDIDNVRVIRAYLGTPLKSINSALSADFKTLNNARHGWSILLHLRTYKKGLKSYLMRLFCIRSTTYDVIANELLRLGYIKMVPHKVKSNLGFLVSRQAYSITHDGLTALVSMDACLDAMIEKIRK